MLAGVPVAEADVLALARIVRDAGYENTAARFEDAWHLETTALALDLGEEETGALLYDPSAQPGSRAARSSPCAAALDLARHLRRASRHHCPQTTRAPAGSGPPHSVQLVCSEGRARVHVRLGDPTPLAH
jgi:hypothetical protein